MTLKQENAPLVEEALQYLNQAVANRANYDDAMAYLNLSTGARQIWIAATQRQ